MAPGSSMEVGLVSDEIKGSPAEVVDTSQRRVQCEGMSCPEIFGEGTQGPGVIDKQAQSPCHRSHGPPTAFETRCTGIRPNAEYSIRTLGLERQGASTERRRVDRIEGGEEKEVELLDIKEIRLHEEAAQDDGPRMERVELL